MLFNLEFNFKIKQDLHGSSTKLQNVERSHGIASACAKDVLKNLCCPTAKYGETLKFMYIRYQPIVVLLPKVYQVRVTRTIYES